jgi:hypothetical protein
MAMSRFQKEDVGIRKSQADSVGQNSSKGICGMDGPDFEDRFEETSGKCLQIVLQGHVENGRVHQLVLVAA